MRDNLGVEELIQYVRTRVRSINRFEVTPYQVLVLSRGQRCLPPRCSPDGMRCPVLSAGDLRGPPSTVDSLEALLEKRGGKRWAFTVWLQPSGGAATTAEEARQTIWRDYQAYVVNFGQPVNVHVTGGILYQRLSSVCA